MNPDLLAVKPDLSSVRVEVVLVTPEMAKAWLAFNKANRKPSQAAVKRWANAMRANAWKLCPDAIAFNSDGILLNGQHRLMAVVASGMAQHFLVARDFPDSSKNTADIGNKRQLHEIMTIDGYSISRSHASVCRFLLTPWNAKGVIGIEHELHRNRIKKMHTIVGSKIIFIEEIVKTNEFTAPELSAIAILFDFIQDESVTRDFVNLLQHGVRYDNTRQPGDVAAVRYREHRLTQIAKGHRNVGMKAYRLLTSVAYKHLSEEPTKKIMALTKNPFTDYSEAIK